MTLYKTVSTDEYQYPNRCTGRTKRKLLRAILSFLEGNDVVVTAFSYKYAKMLSRDVKDILWVMNIRDGIILDNSNKILYHDRIMWFILPTIITMIIMFLGVDTGKFSLITIFRG